MSTQWGYLKHNGKRSFLRGIEKFLTIFFN